MSTASLPLPKPPQSRSGNTAKCDFAVGTAIPANLPHAVSVSLPLWQDNVDYEEGRLTNVMETGYPRFFIHRSVQKLAALLETKLACPHEKCTLFPSAAIAEQCRDFMRNQQAQTDPNSPTVTVRVVRFSILADAAASTTSHDGAPHGQLSSATSGNDTSTTVDTNYIFIVLFPAEFFPVAKSFWQHTGDGISSRQAERCLQLLNKQSSSVSADNSKSPNPSSTLNQANYEANNEFVKTGNAVGKRFYNRYARNGGGAVAAPSSNASSSNNNNNNNIEASIGKPNARKGASESSPPSSLVHERTSLNAKDKEDALNNDQNTYVEERYGRNLPLTSAPKAKLALRRRIAGTLLSDRSDTSGEAPDDTTTETGRIGTGVTEDDVFLFPSGMSAIFHAHQIAMLERRMSAKDAKVGKSVCFGFPYTDTLKILQKWGPGCHFFGNGLDSDLAEFEKLLEEQEQQRLSGSVDAPAPILALFCEFPSNPLLRSPDLAQIRKLADRYGFLVIVDETIGNFVNVEVLPYADVLVSSLTKVFSGDANVMGGSLVLNTRGARQGTFRKAMNIHYEDTYFDEDAIFLERNSRDFIKRIIKIDENTQAITCMLWEEMQSRGEYPGVIKQVFYPKYETKHNYEKCRRKQAFGSIANMGDKTEPGKAKDKDIVGGVGGGGFGGLFSLSFQSIHASEAFYDALTCAKGPSLGTNYTLACPYTILAHYTELDWAAQFGVEEGLVRVSIGLEDIQDLKVMFKNSLRAASQAIRPTETA